MLYSLEPVDFLKIQSRCTASINAALKDQSRQATSRAGIHIGAEMGIEGYEIRPMEGFLALDRENPQLNIAASLRELGLSMPPTGVFDRQGRPIALLAKDGRAYTAQNLSAVEQEKLRSLDDRDETKRRRCAFVAADRGLQDHGADLPDLTAAEKENLRKKCNGDGYPEMSAKGRLQLLNNQDTITVINGSCGDMGTDVWSGEAGCGVLLPVSDSLVAGLNDGSITDFSCKIRPDPNRDSKKLVVEVRATIDGETFTYRQLRKQARYSYGDSLVLPFGPYGAMVYTSEDLEVTPNAGSYPVRFKDNTWKISLIPGGISYVSIRDKSGPLGVVKMPQRAVGRAERVILGLDAGETSAVIYLKVDQEAPRPVRLGQADVFPLVNASAYDKQLICEQQWVPFAFNGMARSKMQLFTAGDQPAKPLPYVYARPCINETNGYLLDLGEENRVFSSFKSSLVVRDQKDREKKAAYQGNLAAYMLLGACEALKYSENIELRVSYPNNPCYRQSFEESVYSALELVSKTLTNARRRPFRFSSVDFRTEGFCNTICVEVQGINNTLGTAYGAYIGGDMGGSTTDLSIRESRTGRKLQLPAIPIAGREVVLSSMAQMARVIVNGVSGLEQALKCSHPDMQNVISNQILDTVRKELQRGGNMVDTLVGLSGNATLHEGLQTLIDYFPLELDEDAGTLLRSLICMKDLLIQDMILRTCAPVFQEAGSRERLHLLRLGNGSKCVDLISTQSHYFNGKAMIGQVLKERAEKYMNVPFQVTFNEHPKTEVALGLTLYDDRDGIVLDEWESRGVKNLDELEGCLEQAAALVADQAQFLRDNVPRICGQIHPYQTGLDRGFAQLLEPLSDREGCESALRDTLRNENGRLGNVHLVDQDLGVGVWGTLAILDCVNRQLAIFQAEMINGGL